MEQRSIMTLALGAISVAILPLLMLGPPALHKPRLGPSPTAMPANPSIAADGFTLTSERIDLPIDDAPLPEGAGLETVMTYCTACHSTAMIARQPRLTREQWTEVVMKMKNTYKAPVPEENTSEIIDYLVGFQTKNQM